MSEPVRCESCKDAPARLKVGKNPQWELCAVCAALPKWKRFGKRDLVTDDVVSLSQGQRELKKAKVPYERW